MYSVFAHLSFLCLSLHWPQCFLAFSNFQLPTPISHRQPIWFKRGDRRSSSQRARMSGAFSETTSTGLPSTESTESEGPEVVSTQFVETDDEAMYYEPRDQQMVKMFHYNQGQEIVKLLQDYHYYGISAQTSWADAPSNGGDAPTNHGDVIRNIGDAQHGHNCRWGLLMFWSGVE